MDHQKISLYPLTLLIYMTFHGSCRRHNRLVSEMRSINVKLIKEDEWLSVQLLMYHHPKDAHLCRTAIVQLPGPQINHLGLSLCKGSESDGECGSTC